MIVVAAALGVVWSWTMVYRPLLQVRRLVRDLAEGRVSAGFVAIEAGEVAEEGGHPATAGAQKEKKLPGLNAEVDGIERDGRAELFGEGFDGDRDHALARVKVGCGPKAGKYSNVTE